MTIQLKFSIEEVFFQQSLDFQKDNSENLRILSYWILHIESREKINQFSQLWYFIFLNQKELTPEKSFEFVKKRILSFPIEGFKRVKEMSLREKTSHELIFKIKPFMRDSLGLKIYYFLEIIWFQMRVSAFDPKEFVSRSSLQSPFKQRSSLFLTHF